LARHKIFILMVFMPSIFLKRITASCYSGE